MTLMTYFKEAAEGFSKPHITIATFINLNLLIENHLILILTSPPVDFFFFI